MILRLYYDDHKVYISIKLVKFITLIRLVRQMKYPSMPQREPTTTITVGVSTAEKVRRLVGEMQAKTGKTVTQRTVIEAALGAYINKVQEEEK